MLHIGSNDPRDDTRDRRRRGTRGRGAARRRRRLRRPGRRRELVGRVTDDELVERYRRADAFLDTSLYEGFGFQVLEAMACGTPVVASDTTSIPELVGDAALLCPPGDVDAFAAALRRLRDEDGLADELRRRGLGARRRVHVGAHRASSSRTPSRRRARVIVFVHGLRNWGAVEEYVAALVRGLRERGEDVALLYPDDPVLAPFAELGARAERSTSTRRGLTRRLRRELRRLRPTIVHVTDVFPQAQLAARLAGRAAPARHAPHARAAAPRQRSRAGPGSGSAGRRGPR